MQIQLEDYQENSGMYKIETMKSYIKLGLCLVRMTSCNLKSVRNIDNRWYKMKRKLKD